MEIEKTVLKHVAEELAPDKNIGVETNLVGVLDSTAIMELVVWIESTFEFPVELDEIMPEHFGSVRLIGEFVQRRLSEKN